MMYEDAYPHFLAAYRSLRKEGVQFPPREASTRFMLSSMGLSSPMFDYLEEVSHVPKGSSAAKRSPAAPAPQPPPKEDRAMLEAEREFKRFAGGAIGVVSRERDMKNLAGVVLSPADIESIKSYMQIIDDICVNAEHLSDLKTDIALEMFKYCQAVHSRCLNLISAKSAHGVEYQLEVLLSLSEDLDVRVKLFKNTFIDLAVHERLKAMGKLGSSAAPAPTSKKEVDGAPAAAPHEVEEQKVPPQKPAVKPHTKTTIKPLPPPPSNPFFQFETKQEPLLDLLDSFEEKKSPEVKPEPIPKKEEGGMVPDLLGLKLDIDSVPVVPVATPVKLEAKVEKKEDDDFFEGLANRK